MKNSKAHIQHDIIRFRRWSHTSYAIFYSIGKQILIGSLAGLIQKIDTVKSRHIRNVLNEMHELFSDSEALVSETKDLLQALYGNTDLTAVIANPFCEGRDLFSNFNYSIISKAFSGPFLFSCRMVSRINRLILPAFQTIIIKLP